MQDHNICVAVSFFILGLFVSMAAPVQASYAFYVGRALTADGSVLIGGTGEEVSSHWLEIVPRRRHEPGSTITVGVTAAAAIPGELIEIPQVRETWRYVAMNYTDYKGFPPPLTNGGMNEWQVAARDVWRPSRREMIELTPRPQRGPQYSDLSRIVLERAKTARQAVEILAALIEKHGYSTYGGNSHLFADPNEGWIVIEVAGGQGIWAAERLAADEVRVLYPGYIGTIPKDYKSNPDYMGSDNLISFAVEQGWYDANGDEPFHFHRIYCTQGQGMREPGIKYVDPKTLEECLLQYAPKITPFHMMAAVRDYRLCDDEAGYGQVAHLRAGAPKELGLLWVAATTSLTAPFVPLHLGCSTVPPQWGQHRYLTKDAGKTFLAHDFQGQEATLFAGRLFKRLLYHVCEYPDRYLPEVTEAFEAFEGRAAAAVEIDEEIVRLLLERGRADLVAHYLTEQFRVRTNESLDLGTALLESIEARIRLTKGIRRPRGDNINQAAVKGRRTVHARKASGPTRQRYGLRRYDIGRWRPWRAP